MSNRIPTQTTRDRLEHPAVSIVIIQPTPFCNIDCRYCYLPDRGSRAKLSMDTIAAAFERIFVRGWSADRLRVIWHAGEPLVLPPSYYREAFSLIESIKPKGSEVLHAFNSNGVLVDEDWCEFLKETRAEIGLSIDGPRELHDAYRVTRAGAGTFDQAMRAVGLLQRHGIDFYVITVLTRNALERPEELYQFYVDAKIKKVCFNPEEIEGIHRETSLNFPGIEQSYHDFLRTFWNASQRNPKYRLYVREFEEGIRNVIRNTENGVESGTLTTYGFLNIDCDGNFSTWSPELLGQRHSRYRDFLLGNVRQVSLEDALKTEKYLELRAEIQRGVERCKAECAYFSVCGGGEPCNKLAENGTFDSTETLFCRLTKKVVTNVALEILDATADFKGTLFGDIESPIT